MCFQSKNVKPRTEKPGRACARAPPTGGGAPRLPHRDPDRSRPYSVSSYPVPKARAIDAAAPNAPTWMVYNAHASHANGQRTAHLPKTKCALRLRAPHVPRYLMSASDSATVPKMIAAMPTILMAVMLSPSMVIPKAASAAMTAALQTA